MDLSYSDEQENLRESLSSFFSKESTPERVRAAEPTGFDGELWDKVTAMGLPAMAVPEDQGGGGASALDLVLTAEEFGKRIPPAPLIESIVATNLLGRLAATTGSELTVDLLRRAIDGDALVTVALHPLVDGLARLVPAGAVADAVLAVDGDEVVVLRSDVSPRDPLAVPSNLGTAPIADRGTGVDERVVLASGPDAVTAYERARSEWQLLMAGAMLGLAQTSLEMGAEYAQQRRAFGVLIAWFQTVQHRLADAITNLEGARLLTYEAGWATDENLSNAPALATMAFLFSSEMAFRVAADSLHLHGGYGYTLEYDIQLFFRRAKAWPLAYGDPKNSYRSLATRLFEDEER